MARVPVWRGALVTAATGLAVAASPVSADSERGRLLYENHCLVCHESTVHVRVMHRVRHPQALRAQVQRWAGELVLDWGGEEFDDVVEYLNLRYYEFGSVVD